MQFIQKFPVEDLKPYEYNNKVHTDKAIGQLVESIHAVGFADPIEIDKDNVIAAGHKRRLAALAIGLTHVPVVKYEDMTVEQVKYYRLASNVHSEQSDWHHENYKIEYDELKLEGFSVDEAGFDQYLLEWNNPQDSDEVEDDDFDPTDQTDIYIKLGDIVSLGGKHRIICGDSTEEATFSALLQGKKAHLLHTDPPYGVDYSGNPTTPRERIKNDNINVYDFYLRVLDLCNLYCKDVASAYIWHASAETHNALNAFIDAGWQYKQMIIWNKDSMVLSRQDYHWKHEPCIYGWKGSPHRWLGDRKQTTVWDVERPKASKEHPTMKPLDLCAKGIQNSSERGDIVLDPFLGSGSTLMASHIAGRKCYGIELEPKYVQVIIDRYRKYCEQFELPFECHINGEEHRFDE